MTVVRQHALPSALEPFHLERYFAEHEFSSRYLLGSSDCESMTIRDLLALAPDAERGLLDCWLGYTESRGGPQLRSAIAGLYERLEARHVLVHAGAQEAIYAFSRALLHPGERVVVQVPAYQSLWSVARNQGCDVVQWRPLESQTEWRWSFDALKALATPPTRAIVINSPQNPTGAQFSESEFRAIVALAEETGALLFSDEVYRFCELDGPPLPAACDLSESAVSLGVLSKSFGFAGLRIGWIATRNAAALEAVVRYKDYLTICNAAPSEFLATLALNRRDAVLARARHLLAGNRALLGAWMQRHADVFEWRPPRAGPVAFVGLRGRSATALCDAAIARGVMLVPSTTFDYGDGHIRVGFGRRNLAEALERFDDAVTN